MPGFNARQAGDNCKKHLFSSEKSRAVNLEKYNPVFDKFFADLAAETNADYPKLLRTDGSIDMDAGGFEFSDRDKDRQTLADCENFFASKLGQSLDQWKVEHPKAWGVIAEKAITAVLYKVLKNDFLVARTSIYDDYVNKVDDVIIDKENGSIICGLNKLDPVEGAGPDRYQEISKTISFGGAHLKYGVQLKDGKLLRRKLWSLPAFLLSVNTADLEKILPDIDRAGISADELRVVSGLVDSMREQLLVLYGAILTQPINFPEIMEELNREKEELLEKYGEEEWSKTSEGRSWSRRHGQRALAIKLKKLSVTFDKIKNILENLKSQI